MITSGYHWQPQDKSPQGLLIAESVNIVGRTGVGQQEAAAWLQKRDE